MGGALGQKVEELRSNEESASYKISERYEVHHGEYSNNSGWCQMGARLMGEITDVAHLKLM